MTYCNSIKIHTFKGVQGVQSALFEQLLALGERQGAISACFVLHDHIIGQNLVKLSREAVFDGVRVNRHILHTGEIGDVGRVKEGPELEAASDINNLPGIDEKRPAEDIEESPVLLIGKLAYDLLLVSRPLIGIKVKFIQPEPVLAVQFRLHDLDLVQKIIRKSILALPCDQIGEGRRSEVILIDS